MNKIVIAMVVSLAGLAGMFMILQSSDAPSRPGDPDGKPLMIFCAASNRAVMEAVKADYEKETGVPLEIQYGGSQTLLSSLEVSQTGDLYLPADDSYMTMAQEKGIVEEALSVASQHGVVAVKKGNPRKITSLEDLFQKDVRLVQASPEATAIGKIAKKLFGEQGVWEQTDQSTTAYRTTVIEVANDIVVDAADAGFVYDAVLHTFDDLEYVEIPELQEAASDIMIGVVASTKQPQRALHFARYLSARDRGQKRYAEHGFRVTDGDVWADVPELSIFAGSMLRPAIEHTITNFEKREGVRVTRVYNGCGILVGQMKAGQHPDVYFACDKEFMQQVTDLFPESTDVSQNELVILVQKGNPHNLTSLQDLTKEGIRVGIGHEKQCAMGWLTQNTLTESGLQQEVMANVTVQTPTGDMLVNQLRTGSLDAAVVYLSNAAGSREELDAYPIYGLSCSVATQPFAIAQESRYRHLASRLFERICSAQSQDGFIAEGFRWQMDSQSSSASSGD